MLCTEQAGTSLPVGSCAGQSCESPITGPLSEHFFFLQRLMTEGQRTGQAGLFTAAGCPHEWPRHKVRLSC